MKKKISSKPTLKQKLVRAFKNNRKPLADKIKPSKLSNVSSQETATQSPEGTEAERGRVAELHKIS